MALVADDLRVVDRVGRRRLVVGDLGERHGAADALEEALALEVRRQGRQIDRLVLVLQPHHRAVEHAGERGDRSPRRGPR